MSKPTKVARVELVGSLVPKDQANELIRQRIMSRIVITDAGCWEYHGARNTEGYGNLTGQNKRLITHRFMYELTKGRSIPDGMVVCHTCDNPPCCNPDHLWLGDKSANAIDSRRKNRHTNAVKTHCKFGHEFTPENTYLHRVIARGRPSILRHCKRCGLIRMRMRAGWPRELAETLPSVGRGYTPVNAKWKRRKSKAA